MEDKYNITQRVKSELAWIFLIAFVLVLPGIITDVVIIAKEQTDLTKRLVEMGKRDVLVYPNFLMECRDEHGWTSRVTDPKTGERVVENFCIYDFSPPINMEYKGGRIKE
ncbi:hypothetical protein [Aeromonas phage ZPAH34]|uniref:hypothetical protein n=1 Tax=Aeromonas phage ZPAH34 TaxID=2924888 RepID=UPI0023296B36|nr:hypothetical protein PQD16_gp123 [Aeromonas phage ZPAH34]UOX39560.1 hypothetical protein [Aeromonas phage ZPAH34]